MKTGFVNCKTAKIKYYTFGKGPNIFLLPPVPMSGLVFSVLEPFIKNKLRVTSIDFPDWSGCSNYYENKNQVTTNTLADLVIDFCHIFFKGKNKPIVIGGSSTGGVVAMLVISRKPTLFKKLFVHASPISEYSVKKKLFYLSFTINICAKFKIGSEIFKTVFGFHYRHLLNKNPANSFKSHNYQNTNAFAVLNFVKNFLNTDHTKEISLINCETLIIACKKDLLVEVGEMERLHKLIKNSKLVIFPEKNHHLLNTDPHLYAKLLINFVNNR